MKPLSLAGVRKALIVAPHPDDETIGAYGLIRALKARSARVRVVVVTDGAGSHPASARWPRHRLVAERRRETLAAMRSIGVPANDVTFLGLPDGGLDTVATRLRAMLSRAAARFGGCDLLVVPAPEDDHPDHRAVSAALHRHDVRLVHYLVWPSRLAAPRQPSHHLRLGHRAAAKCGAIGRYRTQMGAITDDPAGFAVSRAQLARFSHPVERFHETRR